MNIVMVSSECLPFSKTGGLGDVAYSLSKEYVKKGHNVAVITPLYQNFKYEKYPNLKKVFSFNVKMNWRNPECEVYHLLHDGIEYFFIKNDQYFTRQGGLYGYTDDGERYAFFDNASLELVKKLPFDVDIIHCHDWQGGMIPALLKIKYSSDKILSKVKSVITIHNPLFKGYLNRESLYDLFEIPTEYYDNGSVRLENQVSTLKAGIKFADKITTVSPTHAFELKTPEGSKGLWYDLILRQEDFCGILNGMDYDEFNPEKDKIIFETYNKSNFKTNKFKNKEEFCKQNGLDPNLPLFAVVSRLTSQKGIDLILAMSDFVTHNHANFAVLGSGEYWAEESFNNQYRAYPSHNYVYIGYNDEIAHKLYAASDFFIMPSAFEPCGLGQMIAQRYGSLPLVRRTGGLKDSVICYDDDRENTDVANGFGFDNYNVCDALKCCATALNVYSNKKIFDKLTLNALVTDHSWNESANEYIELYKSILK